jgi:hypothetical protein
LEAKKKAFTFALALRIKKNRNTDGGSEVEKQNRFTSYNIRDRQQVLERSFSNTFFE